MGQHGSCYNTNTWPSLSNTQPNFKLSLKPSKAWSSVSKAQSSFSKSSPECFIGSAESFDQRTHKQFCKNSVKSRLHISNENPDWTRNKVWDICFHLSNLPFSLNLFLISLSFFLFQILIIKSRFTYFTYITNVTNWDETLGGAIVLKHTVESFKHSAEFFRHWTVLLKP